MSTHDGHRQRLKERYAESGLDSFEQHQVLELLLFYCIPRRDTNAIAHELIHRFGTVSGVLSASKEELEKVEGLGSSSATFLKLLHDLDRYCQVRCVERPVILNTIERCGEVLIPYFCGFRNEVVYLLCLDAKCKMLCCKEVGEGSVNSAAVPIRRVVEMALAAGATSVVLAHNHPSGVAVPSPEDAWTTRKLARALYAVEIQLVDHLVIADGDYVSLVQSGMYRLEDCIDG
jgi:DNA repair protein RadC